MKSLARWSSLLISVLWAASSSAQTAPQAAPSALPQSPSDLVHLALQQNGLQGHLKPWHIHVTWHTVDTKGNTIATGTWEEWWASQSQFKEVYEQPGFRQTYWATDHGDFTSGDQIWPPWIFTELESIYTPHRSESETHEKFGRAWQKFGKVKLQCLTPKGSEKDRTFVSYCLDPASSTIQVEIDPPTEVALYGSEFFQGQIIPGSARVVRLGLPDTIVQLDSVEELAQTPASLFTPPLDAVQVDPRNAAELEDAISARVLGHGPIPTMTVIQQRTIRSVIVAFDIVVAKDGTVSRVEVVGATPGLDLISALKAVRQERYAPATLNGRPITLRFTAVVQVNWRG